LNRYINCFASNPKPSSTHLQLNSPVGTGGRRQQRDTLFQTTFPRPSSPVAATSVMVTFSNDGAGRNSGSTAAASKCTTYRKTPHPVAKCGEEDPTAIGRPRIDSQDSLLQGANLFATDNTVYRTTHTTDNSSSSKNNYNVNESDPMYYHFLKMASALF
jgi:hypothetical protein